MKRREFLAASLAASATAIAGQVEAQTAQSREFYQIRRYQLQSGPQLALTSSYFSGALIPALGRRGMGPVGAFQLTFGQDTPVYYLLIPSSSIAELAELDLRLAEDSEFLKAAAPFWDATAAAPAFQRVESWLLAAFEGWPKLTPPGTTEKRIFQLRTYESPSNGEHVRKVEMFHSGEFDSFKESGCSPVFFGDLLIGSRMPCLTYMLTFPDMAALEAGWDKFRDNPGWKKLSSNPRFAFDQIVTNITNLVLSPLACSQI